MSLAPPIESLSTMRTWNSADSQAADQHHLDKIEQLSKDALYLQAAQMDLQELLPRQQAALDSAEEAVAHARTDVSKGVQILTEASEIDSHRRGTVVAASLLAAGAGVTIVGVVGSAPAMIVAGAATIASGPIAMIVNSGGIACDASVRRGTQSQGQLPDSAELDEVKAVIIVERRPGRCTYYAYASLELAQSHMDAFSFNSRILFTCQDGSLKQVQERGPPFAANTIRAVAAKFKNIYLIDWMARNPSAVQ